MDTTNELDTADTDRSSPSRPERPIRVAMILGQYGATNVGGAERQVESLASLLVERGIHPIIIGWIGEGTQAPHVPPGVEISPVRSTSVPILNSLLYALGVTTALSRARPDVVHAFNTFTRSSIARWHKRRTGVPYVTKILRSGELGDLTRLAKKPFGRHRLARLVRDADGLVAISSEIDQELAELGVPPERRLRIPNGVNVHRFSPDSDRQAARDLLEIERDGPIVLAVGRFVPEKRMKELSEQWVRCDAISSQALLLIAGRTPSYIDEDLVRVVDHPSVIRLDARRDVEVLYRSADIYVSASRAEGLSNALLEAMSSGLPCVVTDVGGVRDLIDHGRNGLIVGRDDFDGLTRSIQELLADPARAAALGEAARRTVLENFSLERTAEKLAEAYRELAVG